MSDFEKPSPQKRSGHDFSQNPLQGLFPIVYKAGKLEGAGAKMYFDGKVDEAYMEQGFKFYDSDLKSQVDLPKFTAYVIGLYFGAISDWDGKSVNKNKYSTNLVNDTRNDVMQMSYFSNGKREVLATGLYSEHIKPAVEELGRKSPYTKILVVYIPELRSIRQINLNATSEAGFVKAMAKAYETPEWKTKMYGLSELENEMWVFQFTGQYEPVVFSPKEKKQVPATLPADKNSPAIFFQPIITGGVIRPTTEKYVQAYAAVDQMRKGFTAYLCSELAYYKAVYDKQTGVVPTDAQYAAAQAAPVETEPSGEEEYFASKHREEPATEPINTKVTADHDAANSGFDQVPNFPGSDWPTDAPEAAINSNDDDSLPF